MNVTITPTQTEKILTGNQTFSLLSFSMLVSRLKVVYAKDSSQVILQNCTNEINAFLAKYGAVMEKDTSIISEL